MIDHSASDDPKRRVAANFDTVASTYDVMRFLQACARRQIELAPLSPGTRVLDVAAATGTNALAVAEIVGPNGRVVGMDLSPGMVAQARQKLEVTGFTQVEFREGDMELLDFPDHSFEVVLCTSSLFYVPNMLAAVREWFRVLVPGGYVGFSSFGPTLLQPLDDLWSACQRRYGMTPASPPTHRLADPTLCERLLLESGFVQVESRGEQLGYFLKDGQERWHEIQSSLDGMPLRQLTPKQREQIKTEHVAEVDALATPQGVWVDVPGIFTSGRKPAAP